MAAALGWWMRITISRLLILVAGVTGLPIPAVDGEDPVEGHGRRLLSGPCAVFNRVDGFSNLCRCVSVTAGVNVECGIDFPKGVIAASRVLSLFGFPRVSNVGLRLDFEPCGADPHLQIYVRDPTSRSWLSRGRLTLRGTKSVDINTIGMAFPMQEARPRPKVWWSVWSSVRWKASRLKV